MEENRVYTESNNEADMQTIRNEVRIFHLEHTWHRSGKKNHLRLLNRDCYCSFWKSDSARQD